MAGSERLSRASLSSVGPGGGRHRRSAARSYAETISRSSAAADLDFSALEELLGDLDLVFAEYAPDIAECIFSSESTHHLRSCSRGTRSSTTDARCSCRRGPASMKSTRSSRSCRWARREIYPIYIYSDTRDAHACELDPRDAAPLLYQVWITEAGELQGVVTDRALIEACLQPGIHGHTHGATRRSISG